MWSLPYSKTLYLNDTILWTAKLYGNWIYWDESTQNLTIQPLENSQQGNTKYTIELDDKITAKKYLTFNTTVIPNYPLEQQGEITNKYAIVDNWFFFDFNKYEIFKNFEEDQLTNFTMTFRQKDSKPPSLPRHIRVYTNGTIYGLGTQQEIGTTQIECVGIDDAGWETPIEFSLTIRRKIMKFFIHYSLLLQMLSMLEYRLQHLFAMQKRLLSLRN